MLMVQDTRFTLKSTVTGAMRFSAHVVCEQDGIALPCVIDACEIDVLPHEIDASTKHHPLCVHASRPSRLVPVHASRSSQLVSDLASRSSQLVSVSASKLTET